MSMVEKHSNSFDPKYEAISTSGI